MLASDPVEQVLVVGVLQFPDAQLVIELLLELFPLFPVSFQRTCAAPVVMPKLEGLAQGGHQHPREGQRQAGFGFLHRAEVFQSLSGNFA